MGIAITYALANLAVLGLFFDATYRMTRKANESIKSCFSIFCGTWYIFLGS